MLTKALQRVACAALLVVLLVGVTSSQSTAPLPATWTNNKRMFLDWLITGCANYQTSPSGCSISDHHSEYEGYDGFYNNLAKPDLGAVDTPLLRLLPPAYSDGVYRPAWRPVNPITASVTTMTGPSGQLSNGGKTALLVFFGQQVVEELLDAQRPGCPPEYFNIKIPANHSFRTHAPKLEELPLLRTRYAGNTGYSPGNPRQQLGKGFPAGNDQRLPMANPPAPTNHSEYLQHQSTARVNRFFKLGNPRGNENPFLLTFGIVLFRWHNAIASRLHDLKPSWSDERVFNEARKWVIATHQSVVMYDWFPKWIRQDLPPYAGYRPTVDPQVSHVFQSAAMRFGHTLVTSGVYLRNKASEGCLTVPYDLSFSRTLNDGGPKHSAGVRTCNSFWRSPELFLKDMVHRDLRGNVFGPLEFSRRDLMAINIQRGRDHGLPDYNTARKHFGLQTLSSLDPGEYKRVTQTNVSDEVLRRLQEVYGDPNMTDIWPGGLLETRLYGPGQLFTNIIKDQFERIRDGDRFWFENTNNGQFTDAERQRIRQVNLIDILLTVADITLSDIQPDPLTAVSDLNDLPQCRRQLVANTSCVVFFPNNSRTPLPPPVTHPPGWAGPPPEVLPRNSVRTTCHYLPPLGASNLEPCSPASTFDYFTGSAASFIVTFVAVAAAGVALLTTMILLSRWKQAERARTVTSTIKVNENGIAAKERVSHIESRFVVVEFHTGDRRINVRAPSGSLLRTVDLQHLEVLTVRHLADCRSIIISAQHHYDLYLKFSDNVQGHKLVSVLKKFCEDTNITPEFREESVLTINKGVTTNKQRAQELAAFSRLVLSESFEEKNYFLSNTMFRLMDKDQNGFILLKEFWDVMVLFARGSLEEKARLIFNIYDVSQTGLLRDTDLEAVVESMLGSEGKSRDIQMIVNNILESVNLTRGEAITFQKFFELFSGNEGVLKNINLQAARESNVRKRPERFSIYGLMREDGANSKQQPRQKTGRALDDPAFDRVNEVAAKEEAKTEEPDSSWRGFLKAMARRLYNHQVYVWWVVIYTFVMLLIFAERAYHYSVEREHGGLRRIAGYGVTVTRGAASAMMFTYSSLLVTMCRNLLNAIRSSFLHRFFPIDYMVSLHRYIGNWALVWTIIHIVGHSINFYHIATQTPPDLSCLFRDYFRSTHVLPKFHYWCWQTITGFTGVLLTLQCAVIFVFAYFARRYYFKLFWFTHNTYPIFYLLTILHGSGNLVQPPFFHYFFLGPAILFTLDKLVSTSVNTVKIDVIEAQHLPSNVTLLKIRRPPNFSYQAGQWIRIASLAISEQEYHPFTLSSAPHEEHLTLHVRAVGPWTSRLRKEYPDKATVSLKKGFRYPKIYIDGPFGEGHQTWWDYEIAILVGGGIGVTPFASILKHIAHCSQQPTFQIKTKRVMFLWVTNSQRQFEWLTEILNEVEEQDNRGLIRNHIFITQFKNKFDLRTIFLYLAERHFQRVSGTSLFTGLKAITHFSRPSFPAIFRAVKEQYSFASKIGVFTCGNPSLSADVETACRDVNGDDGDVIFKHYYENF
ncbi:LOW QUALITY PROTEIN: dual oxidase 2 [Hyalella azteca]|uniref:NAD(P)H oxidase (H2O2-forming) n=1 Tax=Hyalella azteca TaxID=294128 RepID=A0A979FU84_HYAAZ|nr:LOW QUALITY PROTEIN: dual oxidase 2 [Hyalella azteca]